MKHSFERNEVLEKLPAHLLDLVIDQPYNSYTAQDHAVWRYVMRQNVNFLGRVAHESYLNGLKKTGISIDSIPHMYGMNRILKEIGWAAVAVDGFIPPQAFMEFQAYNVLVIAADIRNIDHIEYTPAPDIIHEAAGHAPIIADSEYAAYLKLFGEIGAKAFSSAKDYELYEAIRHLSIIKEDPNTPQEEITKAEKEIEHIQSHMGKPSEMALIRNLHWWTVEYGLIGTLENFKIYGAGLLSSIGESANCMTPKVKKLPYTIEAVNYSFDITTQQPQLFVTPGFRHLSDVLLEFASTMAFKRGGTYALDVAAGSGHTGTVLLSSGLQVSGTFSKVIKNAQGEAVYFGTAGGTQLCLDNRQIAGHGKDYHKEGFSSPLGRLKDADKDLEDYLDADLQHAGIIKGVNTTLEFASGVQVKGKCSGTLRNPADNKLVLVIFEDAAVSYKGEVLFRPEWGTYDMAVGSRVVSAWSGPADPAAFELIFEPPKEKTHKIVYNEQAKKLHELYAAVRKVREGQAEVAELAGIFAKLKAGYPDDWLAPLEILEILHEVDPMNPAAEEVEQYLVDIAQRQPEVQKLINDGLSLIRNDFELVH